MGPPPLSCGIGVGLYYWGVSEPMYYYRSGALYKPGFQNDDQRAQMAIGIMLFHWVRGTAHI